MSKWRRIVIDLVALVLIVGGVYYGLSSFTPRHTETIIKTTYPIVNETKEITINPKIKTTITVQSGTGKAVTTKGTITPASKTTTTMMTSAGPSTTTSTSTPSKSTPVTTAPVKVTKPKPVTQQNTVTESIQTLNGYMVTPVKVPWQQGATVWTELQYICNKDHITINSTGSGFDLYVVGIGSWQQKQHGAMSGWTIQVNGKTIDRSAGIYPVNKNDVITWVYAK